MQAHDGVEPARGERDVGDLLRDGGARAHGDAHIGGGERRRVVNAVTHHDDALSASHERLHVGMLVLGEQVSPVLGDARLGGDACGGALVIAGEHDDVADALRAKRRNCLGHSCL